MRLFTDRSSTARAKEKHGLALSSGAARGLAHIGAIKALHDHGLTFDIIAGTSIGALIGALYAKDRDIRDAEHRILDMDLKDISELLDPRIPFLSKGLITGNRLKEFLTSVLGDVHFSDLKVPLYVIAADLYTGEEVVLHSGPVIEAIRASISIPGIFVPMELGGRYLVDGGIVNPLPIDVLKKAGANSITACNVIPAPGQRKAVAQESDPTGGNPMDELIERLFPGRSDNTSEIPNIPTTLLQSFHITEYRTIVSGLAEADLLIEPDTRSIGMLDFTKAKTAIKIGENAALEALKK